MSLITSPKLTLGNAGLSVGAGCVRLGQGGGSILQPIVLTSPLGVVFVNSAGAVLTRGTRRVSRITPETSQVIEFASADGAYFASADGVIFSASGAV